MVYKAMEKDTGSEKFRLECLARHKEQVKKLNDMTYKQAVDYCAKIKATKGEIAAKELWKSTEHYARDLERKEMEKRQGKKIWKSSKHWRQDGKNRDSKR